MNDSIIVGVLWICAMNVLICGIMGLTSFNIAQLKINEAKEEIKICQTK